MYVIAAHRNARGLIRVTSGIAANQGKKTEDGKKSREGMMMPNSEPQSKAVAVADPFRAQTEVRKLLRA
jgi:hypothetical protein